MSRNDNVKRPFVKEQLEKQSRAPKSPNGKEDRRPASTPGESGTRPMKGKDNSPNGVLNHKKYVPEKFTTVDTTANKGAA